MINPTKTNRFLTSADYIIFIVALIVRLIHVWMISDSPFFDAPILDADVFDQNAWQIAEGQGMENKAFFQGPLYLYFLAFLYTLFGHNYLIPRLVQVLLGALTAWLTYRLGCRIYNRNVGIIAGVIVSFYGPLVHYSGQLLITTLFVFLVTLFLLQMDRLLDKPTWQNFCLTGLVCGFAAIARPNILIFVPFALVWIILKLKDKGKGVLPFLAGIALVVLPVTVRNYVVEGDVVLISSQAGVNFYMGNNRWSSGRSAWVPGTSRDWWNEGYYETIELAESEAGRSLKSSEVSSYWWKKTLSEILEKPGKWVNLSLRKIRYFLEAYEISDTEDIYYQRRQSGVFALLMWDGIIDFPWGLLFPLALLGLGLTFTWRRQSHLLLFQLSYTIGILLFIITSRYRLPLVPVFAIWGAAGVVFLWQQIKAGTLLKYWLSIIGLIIVIIVVNYSTAKNEIIPHLDGALNLANRLFEKRQYKEALVVYQEALELNSSSSRALQGAGMTYLKLGRTQEAREHLENAIRQDFSLVQAYNNLGMIHLQEGEVEIAKARFSHVLKRDSTNVFAHRGYGDAAMAEKDYSTAEMHYHMAYEYGASDKQLISRWAQVLLVQENYTEALRVNSILLEKEPNDPRIHHNQARIYIYCDSLERAKEELETVLKLDPGNEEARAQLEEVRERF